MTTDAIEPQEPMLREMHFEGGRLTATFAVEHAKDLAAAYLEMCDNGGAVNYVEMQMETKDGQGLIVNVQRREGKTPHQLRQEAEARATTAIALLAEVHDRGESMDLHGRIGAFLKEQANG